MNKIIIKQNPGKMTIHQILLILTATSTALVAGLMYAYACSVNPGLGKLPAYGYITAMQSINREIQNPLFFASFMGTLLLLPVSAWMQYKTGTSTCFLLLLFATFIYAAGVFAVTMFGNVPLNEALDKFNLQSALAEDITRQRLKFEIPWNRLHNIRTIAAIASLVLVLIACVTGNSENRN